MQTKMLYTVTAEGTIIRAEAHIPPASSDNPDFNPAPDFAGFIGQNLFSFLSDATVRHFYSLLHKRVLAGYALSFDYRCDSSAVRREMRMSLVPDGGHISYESIVLKETPREVPLPSPSDTADFFVTLCSVCMKYRDLNDDRKTWHDIELLPMDRHLPHEFTFTHTLCPACLKFYLKEFGG